MTMTQVQAPVRKGRSYDNLVLAERLLDVLECANRLPIITVSTISEQCNIPPSSVVRILETLCAKEYLVQVSRRGGYALTSKVRALSAGFHGSALVVETLKPYVDELTRQHLWPFAIGTLDRDVIVIQYSTIPSSPLAHVRSTLHKRLPLISSGHGRAYLAFCSNMERHHLAKLITSRIHAERDTVPTAKDWRKLIVQTRTRGYSIRAAEIDPETRTIAVPIMLEPGRVVATLGMTFFRRAIQNQQIAGYAASMQATAAAAAARIRDEITLRRPAVDTADPRGKAPITLRSPG